ncbi:MAG: hypothetical protein O7G31_10810 [Calditrichaeota bacterium]|nr:hypothetical protein [Calditrichota bacterium]
MKKHLHEIEEILHNGRLPEEDLTRLRHQTWLKIVKAKRERRQHWGFLSLPTWTWVLASIILILLGVLAMLLLK